MLQWRRLPGGFPLEEIRGVHKYLHNIFREIKKELEEDQFIKAFVKSSKNLQELMEGQENLIREYLENWNREAIDFSRHFEELYKKVEVPYAVVAWNIERIKNKIVEKLIDEGYSHEFLLKIRRYLEDLVDQIAKIYLKRDASALLNFKSSPFSDRLLYSAHITWLTKIAECIEKEDFTEFPVMSVYECEFSDVLGYPESLFVCMDANMCTYVHELHALIHNTANTFYAFYTKGAYYQAYRVFKDLLELIAKLLKTITELYFLAYSDQEANFFKLVHNLSLQKGYKYVSMIDVVGLRSINRTYGEKVGNLVLKEVEKRLRELLSKDVSRTLLVKGATSDFFMLNIDYSPEEIEKLVEEMVKKLHFELSVNGKSLAVEVTVSTIELEPFVELNEGDLRDILYFLKEEAKKSVKHTRLSTGKEERQRILAWINEKYRNVEKIKAKIEKGEIELVFHPIVSASDTEKIAGAEVLVRIKEEERLIPAGVFIDLIYQLNLVERLDRLVLKRLRELSPKLRGVLDTLFINVSARSLASETYLKELSGFISDMKDFKVAIELTEHELLENIDTVIHVSKNGHVAIAVDDFGTGYSSLKVVADLVERESLKFLKIDGSLIRDILRSHAIRKVVDVISVLSKRLNVKTVAEFIEGPEELTAVRSMGIDYCQGYHIARPMPLGELLAWAKSKLV